MKRNLMKQATFGLTACGLLMVWSSAMGSIGMDAVYSRRASQSAAGAAESVHVRESRPTGKGVREGPAIRPLLPPSKHDRTHLMKGCASRRWAQVH